jgi:type I restriction enzyme M protein
LAHFGFEKDGRVLSDDALPAALTAEWRAIEANVGKPFPSYARLLLRRGTPSGDSRYSWTLDLAGRRNKARQEMQPLLDNAASLKVKAVDLKEQLKRLKKGKSESSKVEALESQVRDAEKSARGQEAQAATIDAAVFDLKAVNPNVVAKLDERTPKEIIESIEKQGRTVSEALQRLSSMLADTPAVGTVGVHPVTPALTPTQIMLSFGDPGEPHG